MAYLFVTGIAALLLTASVALGSWHMMGTGQDCVQVIPNGDLLFLEFPKTKPVIPVNRVKTLDIEPTP